MKINKVNFISISIFAIVLFLIAFFVKKPYNAENTEKLFQYLSDCAIIPAVVLLMIHILRWVNNDGLFDGISYAGRFVVSQFFPNGNDYRGRDGYYRYKEEKKEKRKKGLEYDFLIVGLILLVISIIFYVIYVIV